MHKTKLLGAFSKFVYARKRFPTYRIGTAKRIGTAIYESIWYCSIKRCKSVCLNFCESKATLVVQYINKKDKHESLEWF